MNNVNFIAMDIVQEIKEILHNTYQNSTNDYKQGMEIVLNTLSDLLTSTSDEKIIYLHMPALESEIQVDPDEINFFFSIDN